MEALPAKENTYVVDGGYYLHRVDWRFIRTYQDVYNAYVEYAVSHYTGIDSSIVFDGYRNTESTKLAVQRNRALKSNSAEIISQADI